MASVLRRRSYGAAKLVTSSPTHRAVSDAHDCWLTVSAHAPLLSPSQEIHLARRVESGDPQARETLVNHNVRLVASVARRYLGRGLPIEDMIQEGLVGLLRAVDKYDYLRGYRFSTYATHWIRQSISRAVANQSRCIRLPAHIVDALGRVARVRSELCQQLGRTPTTAEMATTMGLAEQRVDDLLRWAATPISLDAPAGEDGSSELEDFVEEAGVPSPADRAFRSAVRDHILRAIDELTPRERAVIALRFGLHDDEPRTLEETGRNLSITRERARQIEAQALAKLRQAPQALQAAEVMA